MPIAHTQGGSAEFRCQFRASRFRLPATSPAGQLGQIVQHTDLTYISVEGKGAFGSKTRFVPASRGTDDARWISAGQRKQARAGRGVEDRLGIDAVGAVKISDVAGLPKAVDAQGDDRVAGDSAEPR
jgi:hypothetical protein